MRSAPLRTRLTVVVTIVFALAVSAMTIVGLGLVERSLRLNTHNNAEALLVDYLDQLYGGSIAPGTPAPESATRFLYLDEHGNEVSALEYQRILVQAIIAGADDPAVLELPESFFLPADQDVAAVQDVPLAQAEGSLILVDSGFIGHALDPGAIDGQPVPLDLGPETIAVGLPIRVGGTPLTIAVSSPLRPVTDSIRTLTRLALAVVPLLVLTIGVATWLIVGRSLRPVDVIAARVDQINSENLEQRVPELETSDELGHLASTMNNMLSRLQTARDTQRQFVSDASHELRSPITAIQATLEVARNQPENVDWTVTAEALEQENTRLAALVDDLLLLATVDELTTSANVGQVDIDEICLTEAQRPHPCPVRVRVVEPVRLKANQAQMTRAIRNLMDNATRHANSEVVVVVSTAQPDGDWALIEVLDDGPGIPVGKLEWIFERFSRIDSSRSRSEGSGAGLGLAITRQIIGAHGGTVVAGNRNDGGSCFSIRLPIGSSLPA